MYTATFCALLVLILSGCKSDIDQTDTTKTSPFLQIDGLATTAHTIDGKHHLKLLADRAVRNDQHHQITAHGVHATFTHRNAHAVTVICPTAQWDERTGILTSSQPVNITHPHGTLHADGGTRLTLATHTCKLFGPITHTLTTDLSPTP